MKVKFTTTIPVSTNVQSSLNRNCKESSLRSLTMTGLKKSTTGGFAMLRGKECFVSFAEAIHKDEQTEALFTDAFNACGPLMMMSIHIIAFNTLLHNPEAFAEQSIKNTATDSLMKYS